MAVTVTSTDVARAIRAVVSTEVTEELTGLLAYARNEVVRIAPGAPDVVHDRAVILAVGYIYDKPTAARGLAYANALRHSGAKCHAASLSGTSGRADVADNKDTGRLLARIQ